MKTSSSDRKPNPKLPQIQILTATLKQRNVRRVLFFYFDLFVFTFEVTFDLFLAKTTAADDLFGEADDISSDSDAEKPPTPGQPLVLVPLTRSGSGGSGGPVGPEV